MVLLEFPYYSLNENQENGNDILNISLVSIVSTTLSLKRHMLNDDNLHIEVVTCRE